MASCLAYMFVFFFYLEKILKQVAKRYGYIQSIDIYFLLAFTNVKLKECTKIHVKYIHPTIIRV